MDDTVKQVNKGLADLDLLIDNALAVLKKDRDRLVVAKRNGVAGYDTATLEAIGRELGITRERVRQIEKAALAKMVEAQNSKEGLHADLKSKVEQAGGIIAFAQLLDSLDGSKNKASIAFLVKLNPDLDLLSVNDEYDMIVTDIYKYKQADVNKLHKALIDSVKASGKPVKIDQLSTQASSDAEKKALEQLITASKVLVNFEQLWGLNSWPEVNPKSIRDRAYLVLKRAKKPLHFTRIASGVIELKPNSKQVTTQAVHNELIKDKRFVLIGRGIYALSEWGYTPGTVADIIESVLAEESPLTKDEIVKRVLGRRQVKVTTVVLNLQEKPQFERVGKSLYKLRDK